MGKLTSWAAWGFGGNNLSKLRTVRWDEKVSKIITRIPDCASCGAARRGTSAVVETKFIAHKVLGYKTCALTGEATRATFSPNITGDRQYGPGMTRLAVSLLTISYTSVDHVHIAVNTDVGLVLTIGYTRVDRVQKLLRNLRILVSIGTIQGMLEKSAKLVEAPDERMHQTVRKVMYTANAIESVNSGFRRLNRGRTVFPNAASLLKALHLATWELTKKWTMPVQNWGQVYAELNIMYPGRFTKD